MGKCYVWTCWWYKDIGNPISLMLELRQHHVICVVREWIKREWTRWVNVRCSQSLGDVLIKQSLSCYLKVSELSVDTQVGISHVTAFNKLSGHWPKYIKRKYDHWSIYEMYLYIHWWHARCTKRGMAIESRSGGDYKEHDDRVVQVISGLGKRMSDETDHPGNRTNPGLLPRQAGCCPLQARLSWQTLLSDPNSSYPGSHRKWTSWPTLCDLPSFLPLMGTSSFGQVPVGILRHD